MTTVEAATCFHCGGRQHSPAAFKVECSECHRYWHHRCHIPPISDNELIARVKASTLNDVDNGLTGWVCRECLGDMRTSRNSKPVELRSVIAPQPAAQPSNRMASGRQTLPSRLPPSKKDPAVLKYKQSTAQKHPVLSRSLRSSDHHSTSSGRISSDRNNKIPLTSGQTRNATSDTPRQAPRVDLQHVHPPSSRKISTVDGHAGKVFSTQDTTRNSTEVGNIYESSNPVSKEMQVAAMDGGPLPKRNQSILNNHQPGPKGLGSVLQTNDSAEPVPSDRRASTGARNGLGGQGKSSNSSDDRMRHGIVAPQMFDVDDDIQEIPSGVSGPRPRVSLAPSPIPSSSTLSTSTSVQTPPPVQSLAPTSPPSYAEQHLRRQLGLPRDQPVNLWALQDPPGRQKPNHSYPNLITLAIFGSPNQTLTLNEIYGALIDRFKWFKDNSNEAAWKTSIRHSLSHDNAFVTLSRSVTGPDKGEHWCLKLRQVDMTQADDPSHSPSQQSVPPAYAVGRSQEREPPAVHSLSSISSALQSTRLREQSLESGVDSSSTQAAQRMDEDVNMEDDDDDLYGPLPEQVQLVPRRHKSPTLDMEVDEIEINKGQSDSVSHPPEQPSNQPTNNKTQETSWMHGKFAHAAGDPWDRLLRRKRSPVVGRLRAKIQAKTLDSNHALKVENLVNFSIDEWIKTKRGS